MASNLLAMVSHCTQIALVLMFCRVRTGYSTLLHAPQGTQPPQESAGQGLRFPLGRSTTCAESIGNEYTSHVNVHSRLAFASANLLQHRRKYKHVKGNRWAMLGMFCSSSLPCAVCRYRCITTGISPALKVFDAAEAGFARLADPRRPMVP